TIQVQSVSNPGLVATVTATMTAPSVTALPAPPPTLPPPATTPQPVPWLQQVYQDLLGRALDADGDTVWTALLDNGLSRTQVLARIETSGPQFEYFHAQVQALYQQLLQRSADATGLAAWMEALQDGANLEQVAAAIAGSPEYYQLHGGSADGFLQALY